MDFLKRGLAPISSEGWKFIDERAGEVIKANLSARRFAAVVGPMGQNTEAVGAGKMQIYTKGESQFGVYKVQPLVEQRIHFKMNRWDLDNVDRGAKDIDTSSLDTAVKKAALFEESAIYEGLEEAGIAGLLHSSEHEALEFGKTFDDTMNALVCATSTLKRSFADAPYALIISPDKWSYLNLIGKDSGFIKHISESLHIKIIVSNSIKNAYLVPMDNENIEITLGQDFALGFQSYTSKEVELFITSSFTFRVLDPSLVVVFK